MSAYGGDMGRNVDTASGHGEDALLSAAHPPAENGTTCSPASSNAPVDTGSVVGVSPGPVPEVAGGAYPKPSLDTSRDASDDRPPITAQMLRVLQLEHVIHNPKLRHDVNFDPYLHFRPNTDTIRGERRRRRADEYWATLGRDLKRCASFGRRPADEAPEVPQRVQRVLEEIRDILCSLVPQRDNQAVRDALDPALLKQQISRSSLDYPQLAIWLAGVIKLHCAPMRDAWVDEMVMQFRMAAKDGDQTMLVKGVRTLFGILEAMKLVGIFRGSWT